jgi:hydantoinase/carbamoylase family amidase
MSADRLRRVEQYVSGARIEERIARLAEIGGLANGGMSRLPFTQEDGAARELFARWLGDLGLSVRVDGGGNVIGRREGTDPDAPVVMSGSHLDTQARGGRFDGIAGVIAALEAVEAMREAGVVHRHPVEVVDWACEEAASRFDLSMPGSRAMVGALRPEELEARCRLTGVTLREAMESIGIDVSTLAAAERAPGSVKAVVELHIEQGPHLDRAGKQIGIVTGIPWIKRFHCTLRGQQAHAGGMPMDARRDALCGAAEVLLAVESIARARADPPMVATVGYMEFEPRAVPIIPGQAMLIVEARCIELAALDEAVTEIKVAARQIADRRQLELSWGATWEQRTSSLMPEIAERIARACDEVGASYQYMASGGGHDTMMMARRFPAGMLFVPSVGGISHAPEEYSRTEDLKVGAKVLCRTLCELAE